MNQKESIAFYKFFKKNKKFNIYVARYSATKNQFTNSKPCQQCSDIIKKYGFKFVIYSIDNNQFIKENIKELKCDHMSKGIKFCCRVINENSDRNGKKAIKN